MISIYDLEANGFRVLYDMAAGLIAIKEINEFSFEFLPYYNELRTIKGNVRNICTMQQLKEAMNRVYREWYYQ